MAPRRRCPVCGSKQWRKEPSSGLITCGEGHVLQNYRNETSEVNELGPHALRKRALKSSRKKKERQSRADPKLYHGERGRYHYYQCLQLLLRMQVKTLIDAWDLPPEFEVVCRDIWALHLALLPHPPPAEPYLYAMEQYGGSKEQQQPSSSDPRTGDGNDKKDENLPKGAEPSSSSSSDDDEDPDMEKLLRENSEASSSSEDEEDQLQQPKAVEGAKRPKSGLNRGYDSPAGNIAVLMLAFWTLRIPIMYMDLIRLIEAYKLPYLDPIRLLPHTLTLHLTKQSIQSLSPHFAPSTMVLNKLTTRLGRLTHQKYRVWTPECNAAPLLWRAVRNLHGTPTLYILAKKLAKVLSLTLSLHPSLSPTLKRVKQKDPEHHKYDSAPVEVSLAATVIVALKLVYGLDEKERTPTSPDDPACALPNLHEYLAAIRRSETQHKSPQSNICSVSTDMPSALELNNRMLDDYLDFCEEALLPPASKQNHQEENIVLRDFFPPPTHKSPPARGPDNGFSSADADAVVKAMSAIRLREKSTDLRPGQAFRIYNTQDILGALPEPYELIVEHTARWAGVDAEYICGIVEKFEKRLARWWDKVKRNERASGENKGQTQREGSAEEED